MASDQNFFNNCLLSLYLIAPPTYISLRFLQAPYGKHRRPGWGPTMSPPLAWFLMESPTLWLTLLLFPSGSTLPTQKPFFSSHPFSSTTSTAPASTRSASAGIPPIPKHQAARWVSQYKDYEADGWFWWRFCVGLAVFGYGMAVNIWSDRVLVGLKKEGKGYKVPKGGCFELVSCPNYYGEIVEWLGWAVMTWSWAGLGFFPTRVPTWCPGHVRTISGIWRNLGRIIQRGRKAVIPFLY
ncbi:steroid 5-alpha-reductase DET2 [Prunus yedoensis var. nudiflora]|uniref:Steroid 5-alpha-reductase DET2 n=1 Tax=Prunus yedoensis var. nudiflora TaxID=2094558 RepID=A0A314UZA2_PRUYE|nr:steroid 5-alpha-reductase DET2 [Prunus yedoensis var. nudiflora]